MGILSKVTIHVFGVDLKNLASLILVITTFEKKCRNQKLLKFIIHHGSALSINTLTDIDIFLVFLLIVIAESLCMPFQLFLFKKTSQGLGQSIILIHS